MFTGIVEELGTVENIGQAGQTLHLTIQAETIMSDMKLGDSIAINGVCLTVTSLTSNAFTLDVMPETFHATSLKMLGERSQVNLERSVQANGRFGGHFVTGHVDSTGHILKKATEENAIVIDISVPEELEKFLLLKGSIAVDGISLTVFGIEKQVLTISIIPHTAAETTLTMKSVGDVVNLETDMLAKYLYQFMQRNEKATTELTEQFLRENGF